MSSLKATDNFPGFSSEEIDQPEAIQEAVDLLKEAMGSSCGDLITVREAIMSGGYCVVLKDRSKLVGAAWGLVGLDDQGVFIQGVGGAIHSDYQNGGAGVLIAQRQLDAVQARGIERFRYTFDPLSIQRGHFFVNKMGAQPDQYVENCYGQLSGVLGSQTGDLAPSDRVVVTHYLNKELAPSLSSEEVLVTAPHPRVDGASTHDAQRVLRSELAPLLNSGSVITHISGDNRTLNYRVVKTEPRPA